MGQDCSFTGAAQPSELACWTPAVQNLPASNDSPAGGGMQNGHRALQSPGACSGPQRLCAHLLVVQNVGSSDQEGAQAMF